MLLAPDSDNEPHDELYLERFQAFMDKIMADIHAFSVKESRSFDQTKRDVARWHFNQLFSLQSDIHNYTYSILVNVSNILQSLLAVLDLESFVLAVNPQETASQPFLGGTMKGREFWRGMRNGGDSGAKAFKEYCLRTERSDISGVSAAISCSSKQSSKNVKEELYDAVRKALRSVSGIRNAEMKWTNHDRLFTYGVYLVGWPSDIPLKNPSSLKANQNKRLLELLNNGTLRFIKSILLPNESSETPDEMISEETVLPTAEDDVMGDRTDEVFSWAIQYEEVTPSPGYEAKNAPVLIEESAESSIESARPRKRVRHGERIRFHSELESYNGEPL